MGKKTVLLLLLCFTVPLSLVSGPVYAEDELAAIRAALHQHRGKWVAGETSISRLPAHEKAMRARLIKPQVTGAEQVITQNTLQAAALSSSLDWRNNGGNFVTPVKDQGSCGPAGPLPRPLL